MNDELRRAIRKLIKRLERNSYSVLFSLKLDFDEGLNAAEINRLAGADVISSVGDNSPGTQHEITFHHPDDADEDEVWVISDKDTRSLGNDSHHTRTGENVGPKLRDTIAILQAWAEGGSAGPKPEPQVDGLSVGEVVQVLNGFTGDDGAARIFQLARNKGKAVDTRLFELFRFDPLYRGKTSVQLGDLLDENPGVIRGCNAWKERGNDNYFS